MASPLRTALSGAFTALLLSAASTAFAAGTVTITQMSPIGMFGDYTLTYPNGSQVTVNEEESRVMASAPNGTYLLHITPPVDAKMSTTVEKAGETVLTTVDRDVSFTVSDDEVAVTMHYRYDGTITVESEPTDASFELLGPNSLRIAGYTPQTYTGMAPGEYRVTFHRRDGCTTLSPIQRSLDANATLTVLGKFSCGTASSSSSSSSVAPEEPIPDTNEGRTVRIWVAAQQAEALPGGTVRTTITVKNTGARTVHNVVVSAQIDPSTAQFGTPLPRFGTVVGETAYWEIPQVYSGQSWSVTLPLTLQKNVKQGTKTTVTARVSASDLAEENGGGSLTASTTLGVTGLPVTGWRFDVLFLIASLIFTAVIAKGSVRRMVEEQA